MSIYTINQSRSIMFFFFISIIAIGGLVIFSNYARAKEYLTLQDRVGCQKAVEKIYWAHQIWPKENQGSKPSFEKVISAQMLEMSVAEILKKSNALEYYWGRPITAEQLQAEMDRIAQNTRRPAVLKEIWNALSNNPQLIAECLARPILADRLIRNWYLLDERFHGASFDEWWSKAQNTIKMEMDEPGFKYHLLAIEFDACTNDTWTATRDQLIERYAHTAIWTGNEMIVWGGKIPGPAVAFTNTGGRYNPATDTWSYTSIVGAPSQRGYHTAVWDGNQMIVWGGYNGTAYPAAGAIYHPGTDSWSSLSTSSQPAPRGYHTAVWTGSVMVVWGGFNGAYLNTGGRYNPASDTWSMTSTANVPAIREYHSSVWSGSEMIIWGGYNGSYLSTGGKYNPGTDTWVATSTVNNPTQRDLHTAVWSSTLSLMIVWGGYDGSAYLNSGKTYNPVSDTWMSDTPTTNAPSARRNHTAIISPNEMVIWGGEAGGNLNTGGILNLSGNSWTATSMTNVPISRIYHTAVWSGTEMIIWGGYASSILFVNSGGRLNPTSNSWVATALNNTPTARYNHTAIWTGTELIIWGGYNGTNYYSTGARYNPTTDNWVSTKDTNAPAARIFHTAIWTGSEMIVWGGRNASGSYQNTGGIYGVNPDPSQDTWAATPTTNAPSGRIYHTAVWSGADMLIWGGLDSIGDQQNTGGRYMRGTNTWSGTVTSGAPSARYFHTAIWSSTTGEMIVWGGSPTTDTGGRYVPSSGVWTPTSLTNAPAARAYHTAVWTGTEMIIWGGAIFNTGGRYSPGTDTWTATSTIGTCSARYLHTGVWTGSEMIIWGGFDGSSYMNTGCRYDPSNNTWTATSTINAPASRYRHTAVWGSPEMIIWGGTPETQAFNTGGRYCAVIAAPPGTVPDNDNFPGTPFTLIKSGTNLLLNWSAPGGTCQTQNYGIYRGTLPWSSYNHASVSCSTGGATTATISSDTGSYYYLIVAQNSGNEGSYGLDSTNAQRPAAAVPCIPQQLGNCN